MRLRRAFAIACAVATLAGGLCGQALRVAAASDLMSVLPEITALFEKHTGAVVELSFGSSGNFFAQIQNGAPFDVFLSADIAYPQKLAEDGLTRSENIRVYATGRLVLWKAGKSEQELERSGLNSLLDSTVHKIAIANPEHAPYGRAAVSALKQAGLYEKVKDKLVMGENISQTAQFVQSGNAEAGLIALSLAKSPAMRSGHYIILPTNSYPPIQQAAAVITTSRQGRLAYEFLAFLGRPEAQAVLRQYGFDTSPGPSKDPGFSESRKQ